MQPYSKAKNNKEKDKMPAIRKLERLEKSAKSEKMKKAKQSLPSICWQQ